VGSHEDTPVAISLDAIGELGEVRVRQDLGPTRQVESGLRSQIWKFDGDRHEGMIRQKRKDCIGSRRSAESSLESPSAQSDSW
jgi:hypothetical protein